ncbi:MAG: hypothetical protein R3Y53_06270 [Bacillota bacterium]
MQIKDLIVHKISAKIDMPFKFSLGCIKEAWHLRKQIPKIFESVHKMCVAKEIIEIPTKYCQNYRFVESGRPEVAPTKARNFNCRGVPLVARREF